jgi:glutamate-1-semialdehyde 2,1-aminomutase
MTPIGNRSSDLYQRALKVLPGGVSRNTVLRRPYPAYAARGEGCRVWDLEGVERIDFSNNMASLIHGHAHPAIVAAVSDQLRRGTAFTMATEQEVSYAEHLCGRSRFDRIRFVNSGTEAVMGCLKAARAFTGRPRIAKVEGAYHGLYDYAEVSQTSQPSNWGEIDAPASVPVAHGTPAAALADVVVIPFNDRPRARAILDRHAGELACVLLDPMPHRVGLTPASADFVRALRAWCDTHGALLVFDEVITYRSSYGGAQDWYDVAPDLTAMGKMIGGGFPVGALAGRAEVMEVLNPLAKRVLFPHSGTFSANPVTMVAGHTAMRLFDAGAVAHVNALADRVRAQITEAIAVAGACACVTGAGSMFRVHLKAQPPRDYRSALASPQEAARLAVMLDHLFLNGMLMIDTGSGTISTPMTTSDTDRLAEAMLGGFRKLAAAFPADGAPAAGAPKDAV